MLRYEVEDDNGLSSNALLNVFVEHRSSTTLRYNFTTPDITNEASARDLILRLSTDAGLFSSIVLEDHLPNFDLMSNYDPWSSPPILQRAISANLLDVDAVLLNSPNSTWAVSIILNVSIGSIAETEVHTTVSNILAPESVDVLAARRRRNLREQVLDSQLRHMSRGLQGLQNLEEDITCGLVVKTPELSSLILGSNYDPPLCTSISQQVRKLDVLVANDLICHHLSQLVRGRTTSFMDKI